MEFLCANIDRAIVMTQYDLRGFADPMGFGRIQVTPKILDAITCNFMSFAAGNEAEKIAIGYVSYFGAEFNEYLVMCKDLASECDGSQKEAIQFIYLEIARQNSALWSEVTSAKKPDGYLHKLEKGNHWGNAMIAVSNAFGFIFENVPEAVCG